MWCGHLLPIILEQLPKSTPFRSDPGRKGERRASEAWCWFAPLPDMHRCGSGLHREFRGGARADDDRRGAGSLRVQRWSDGKVPDGKG